MDVMDGLPEEFALLRRELAGINRRFARGLVHPLEAVLSLAVLGLRPGFFECHIFTRSCWRDWV